MHPVFHVIHLKPFVREPPQLITILVTQDSIPERICKTQSVKEGNEWVDHGLVQWEIREHRSTWEILHDI